MASGADNDGGSEEDGYIQLLSPASRSRSKRRRVKTLSNQTRFIVDRRVTAQADLLAPVESTYIVWHVHVTVNRLHGPAMLCIGTVTAGLLRGHEEEGTMKPVRQS